MVAYTVLSIAFFGVLLFWPAGTFHYWQAWVFIAVFVVTAMVPTIYLAVAQPDAFRRRTRPGPFAETRTVQKVLYVGIFASVVAVAVLSALDHRFGWSTVPTALVVLANALVAIGLAIAEIVVIQNNYAGSTITVDAGQTVVSTGMYGIVRHPMYVGALIMAIGMPLALASYWGLIFVLPCAASFVARILDEERFLRTELAGYDEYTDKVRYRLVPGVW
ncbi:isoprenylcysteine carboxylmethyltransferase family protein [Mycolicibacterium moriokaense]|nr:isoprenylcysteine carboxylmethyltransferase family protein [Mycolicibacterium moriokaense]